MVENVFLYELSLDHILTSYFLLSLLPFQIILAVLEVISELLRLVGGLQPSLT